MPDFASSARILAGHSAQALGWMPDVFWNATPAELAASLAIEEHAGAPLTRGEIAQLIERDHHGR